MGIALLLDQSELADTHIGLPQSHAVLFGEPHQTFAGAMHQPRVGRKSDPLWLLHKCREFLFAHSLPPARHRRALEGQFVLEELFAAEQLVIWVLDPALAQNLV
jgi:hypothetical protein